MSIQPSNIKVKQSSNVLMNIAFDESLSIVAKKACDFQPQDFQHSMQGKDSISKFMYFLYCQELKVYHHIKNRKLLLKTITYKLIDEQTELKKAENNPHLKPETKEQHKLRLERIIKIERIIKKLNTNLDNLDEKLKRVKQNRIIISKQFVQQADNFKKELTEVLNNNGMSNTQGHEITRAIQTLLGVKSIDLTEEEKQARLNEIPKEVKELLGE